MDPLGHLVEQLGHLWLESRPNPITKINDDGLLACQVLRQRVFGHSLVKLLGHSLALGALLRLWRWDLDLHDLSLDPLLLLQVGSSEANRDDRHFPIELDQSQRLDHAVFHAVESGVVLPQPSI